MRISKIVLRNFQCYKGEHELKLEAKAYAIIARHQNDEERSNWLGKSTLFEAIRFVLFGDHRHTKEDDWITHEQEAGSVSIWFDTGECMTRGRNRGEVTVLVFINKDGLELRKSDAQQAIETLIGVGRQEFQTSCYFEQKHMARFILATPSERAELVTRWFSLEKLAECEKRVDHDLGELLGKEKLLGVEFTTANAKLEVYTGGLTDDGLRLKRAELQTTWERLSAEVQNTGKVLDSYVQSVARSHRKAQYDEIVARGVGLKIRLMSESSLGVCKGKITAVQGRLNESHPVLSQIAREMNAVGSICSGTFDGLCPLMEAECPAKDKVNESRTIAGEMLKTIRQNYNNASSEDTVLKNTLNELSTQVREHEEIEETLRRLRAEALELKRLGIDYNPQEVLEYENVRAKHSSQLETATVSSTALKGHDHTIEKVVGLRYVLRELLAKQDEYKEKKKLLLSAKKVFGRTGAFKLIAERRLASIESLANEVLQRCGVELSVSLSWSYEGQGLASHCETCGHPFPVSAKVKSCESCTSPRGNKVVRRLQVELSDRSGAAEDMAGVAIQLAASSCLRAWRGVEWGVLMLDEPFGSLDSCHRKAFASHLAGILKDYGAYTQSFTIAHHNSILDALPGRIEIVSNGTYSSVRVVA